MTFGGDDMEYLLATANMNQTEVSSVNVLEHVDQVLTIANSLLALVVIIIGWSWLKPLKEKQSSASFTFWAQLRIRLIKIRSHLKVNNKCLYYLYSQKARESWSSILAPDPNELNSLKITVDETLTFLQSADDQMPPYFGWTDDYTKLLYYLTDIMVFDICNPNAKFKFTTPVEYSDLLDLQDSICTLIESMCANIVSKQKSIENKLTIAWYKRIRKQQ